MIDEKSLKVLLKKSLSDPNSLSTKEIRQAINYLVEAKNILKAPSIGSCSVQDPDLLLCKYRVFNEVAKKYKDKNNFAKAYISLYRSYSKLLKIVSKKY
jgi:hypothetical protein